MNAETQALIERLAIERLTAADIERELIDRGMAASDRPSRRTVQRIVQAARYNDQSGAWSLGDAEGDEASLILPVLRAYLNLTAMRTAVEPRDHYITKAEARWITRIRRVAPDLHVFDVYRLARAYLARVSRNLPTYDLDALMSFEPWDETPRDGPFGSVYTLREAYQKGVREGWIPKAPAFLMAELAGIDWTPRTTRENTIYVRALFNHLPDAYEEAALDEAVPSETPASEARGADE